MTIKCEYCGSDICAICGSSMQTWASGNDRGLELKICHKCFKKESEKRKEAMFQD